MPILLLDSKAVNNLMKMADVMDAVEGAFKMWGEGRASMPAKAYLQVEEGDFRAMPAALPGCAGLKWVNAHPRNPRRNLPSVMAVIIYNDPETGYPLAIMDATRITAYRTGAASAIASKYLARQNSRTLGLIGTGYQAQTQILAHARLFKLDQFHRTMPPVRDSGCRTSVPVTDVRARSAKIKSVENSSSARDSSFRFPRK